ncbi:glycosyl transferase family 90-domain-containing protein [Roridomyces roridus]|uniref:Glycosyl transferase family 90-domain-containing protein n=1 Tax=Roridomyces roridus TaxID=1738132 RepID=A0AAD7BDY0_9AGAR|nr:glycosyl transferase family 90-domain-containing protein [Roridomyces roridus]
MMSIDSSVLDPCPMEGPSIEQVSRWLRKSSFVTLLIASGLFSFFIVLRVFANRSSRVDHRDFSLAAHKEVDELFARQSFTFEEASPRYALRNGREPPPGYVNWFLYAKEHKCLVDDYEQVQRDFEPFYQLAKDDPKFFKRMVDRGLNLTKQADLGIKTLQVQDGEATLTDAWNSNYHGDWLEMLNQMTTAFLPPTALNLVSRTLSEARLTPKTHCPSATTRNRRPKFYTDEKHCLVPNAPTGFLDYANDATSFLMYSASADFTTDLYPVLSQCKIYPCFSDILYPSAFHYPRSYWYPKYAYANNITWTDKKPVIYWRGQSTGGWIKGDNYRSFPRFKLIDMARAHPHLPMDVAITHFYDWFCREPDCDEEAVKKEYNIVGEGSSSPREDVYKFKWVLDLDGNAFSGRYLGLLKSGSLVFKSTVFTEYFSAWLKPFEHYIPVLPDLSDLPERIEWALTHDAEAQRIMERGKAFVERVITDEQNDCYWGLVLLEWARLQNL